MKNETKKTIKNNVTTGASSAVGAVAGVTIGAALSPAEAQAQEISEPEVIEVIPPTDQTAHQTNSTPSHTQQQTNTHNEISAQEPANTHGQTAEPTEQQTEQQTEQTSESNDEIQVLAYDRVTDDNGNQADLAVVSVNGNEVGIIDNNLDGEADVIVSDINQNGVIEENEIADVQGQGISMEPLQEAAGFNPEFAQNNLPDYVNDADIDSYMA